MSSTDYFSLDAILAETQRLPTTFNLDVPNMGHLEGTSERHLHANVPIDLPFWLAAPLATMAGRDFVTLSIPQPFNKRVRNGLAASSRNVNLRQLAAGAGGWYDAGIRLDSVIDDPSLRPTLHSALKTRLPEIMDLASRPPPTSSSSTGADAGPGGGGGGGGGPDDAGEFVQGLDEWEKEMLRVGRETAGRMRAWTTGKQERR